MTDDEYATHQRRVAADRERMQMIPLPSGVSMVRIDPSNLSVTPRPRKYRNIPTEVDGITFGSRKEAKRYRELVLLQQSGAIRGLTHHNRYSLVVNGIDIGDYEDDFAYWRDDRLVIEDSKGVRTPVFKMKKQLMLALYAVEVIES